MFTGIIEEVGVVSALTWPTEFADHAGPGAGSRGARSDAVLAICAPQLAAHLHPGQSVSVDGACLTVTGHHGREVFNADVMPETLARTAFAAAGSGTPVNLERGIPAGGRLDGHIVQGHVDDVITLARRDLGPRWDELTFTAPQPVLRYLVPKGSIAVAGVSLTVMSVGTESFAVGLIPHTLQHTTLGALRVGQGVNVEIDVLAKYTERLLTSPGTAGGAR